MIIDQLRDSVTSFQRELAKSLSDYAVVYYTNCDGEVYGSDSRTNAPSSFYHAYLDGVTKTDALKKLCPEYYSDLGYLHMSENISRALCQNDNLISFLFFIDEMIELEKWLRISGENHETLTRKIDHNLEILQQVYKQTNSLVSDFVNNINLKYKNRAYFSSLLAKWNLTKENPGDGNPNSANHS